MTTESNAERRERIAAAVADELAREPITGSPARNTLAYFAQNPSACIAGGGVSKQALAEYFARKRREGGSR